MKEKVKYFPIIFSTLMVQSILRGEKTQTRRIAKFEMKYNIGDVFWVRETWQHTKILNFHQSDENYGYVYKADGEPWSDFEGWKWKSPIFMPKVACRIFLKIINIRSEKLNNITSKDAIAEGIERWKQQGCIKYKSYVNPEVGFLETCNSTSVHPAIASFRSLWTKIYGLDSLNSNPWVFVYEFERGFK